MAKVLLDIESYRSIFKGGARQYLFFVLFDIPGNKSSSGMLEQIASNVLSTFGFGANKNLFPYLVKATSLPESSIDEKTISLQGTSYKLPGNKTYGNWSVTLNVDDEGQILDKLYNWQNLIINSFDDHNFLGTKIRTQNIFLVDYQGNTFGKYTFYDCWPKSIGNINLDYSTNAILTVDVTFSFHYFTYEKETPSGLTKLVKAGVNALVGKIT